MHYDTVIGRTQAQLEALFAKHPEVVLWCSGGKDSLTLLHLCQPYAGQVVILHNEMDGGWPGVRENLERQAAAWGFPRIEIIHPPIGYAEYVERYGWPVEVVPSAMSGQEPHSPYAGEHKVSSWWHCSMVRSNWPLLMRTMELGIPAMLTGSRAQDAPAFAAMGAEFNKEQDHGIVRYNPLHHWETAEVYTYVDAKRIVLPDYYRLKRDPQWSGFEWVDCLHCTWKTEHLRLLHTHYPQEFWALWKQFAPVAQALEEQLEVEAVKWETLRAQVDLPEAVSVTKNVTLQKKLDS